ncbi:hypothetical protein HKX48_004512 [Thoreauomyces humboldtii]|nr:hypothetical protein HKX48_004512 [Thoreauomyces humboldtii]
MVDQRRYVADMPDSGRFMDHHYTVSFERHKDQNTLEERKFLSVLSKLSEYGLVVNLDCYMDIRFVPQVEVPKPYDVHAAPLPFNVKFKLLGLLSYNIVSEFNVDDEFIQILVDASPAIAEGALEQMMKPKLHLWKPKDSLRKQLENTAAIRNKIITNDKLNYNQRLIRKIVITPTKIYYQGPQLELINRVLRIHRDEHDNFMRVTFAEDDLQRLSSARGTELLFNRIEAIFHAGVNVAGQWFNFLHYSNSSMKNSGCWFVSPFDKGFTSTTAMLDTLGDFSTITNPATLGARIAQCFSSTTVTGKLSEDNVREIADIERNGFVFSDGVGLLGRNIAKNQFANLQKHQRIRPRCPAALQFRLGGSKGVLVLSNTIPKNEVHIRKSQMKYIRYHMKPFESSHHALEICRTSFYSPGYLNHQYIILLETLGIRKEVFLELRDECIKQLDQAMQEPTEAMRVLAENQDELGISHTLMQLVKAGFFDAREPFLINQLKLFRALQLRDLKRRAKIHVKKSCTLLGVMDETGALLEGKLYVQYTDPLTLQTRVHEGPVIVCRSPCLHPGDVQIAECVDIKELKHLEDVVVFSQHGERPLPNMLAGGDLDGDTFFVCWDERLIPKVTDQPMKYVTGATAFRDEGATAMVKNTGRHFINFLKNDNLGRIDNAWKAWADISSQGARNRNAIKLAELHSDAVDFAKKGVPAIMPSDLTPSEWPDFMEKPRNYRTYESTKAIGHIYRSVSTGLELVKDFKPLPELIVEGYEEYLHDARLTKEAYDRQISALMNQYDIGSEFELVSGYMFKLDDLNIKKRPMELKEQVMQSVHIINTQFRELFWTTHIFEEPAIESFRKRNTTVALTTPLHDQIKRKASAWYMAAYDLSPSQPAPRSTEEQQAVRRRTDHLEGQDREYYLIDWDMSGRFYSFPWIMYDVLCNIFYLSKHGSLESTGPGGVQRPVRFGSTEGQVPKLGLVGSNDFTTTVLRPAGKEEFFAQVGVSSRGSQSTN